MGEASKNSDIIIKKIRKMIYSTGGALKKADVLYVGEAGGRPAVITAEWDARSIELLRRQQDDPRPSGGDLH